MLAINKAIQAKSPAGRLILHFAMEISHVFLVFWVFLRVFSFFFSPGFPKNVQGWPHLGLPDVWDFDFIEMSPEAGALTWIVSGSGGPGNLRVGKPTPP